jgi:hypothetical protein
VAISGVNYVATCTTSVLTVGSHSITAVYSGDGDNAGSASGTLAQVVDPTVPGVEVGSSVNPAITGVVVTLTATVTGSAPTGNVAFRDGTAAITGCDARPVTPAGGSSVATCATAALGVGSHGITAVYSGDGNNGAGTSTTLLQTMNDRNGNDGSTFSRDYVQKVYVAYYGRPADPGGQAYWAGRMDAEGQSPSAIITAFGDSDEFNRRYGGLSSPDLVTRIYQQTLGRSPDPAGLDYYVGELQAGRRTLQSITLDVLNGATTAPDSTVVTNKLDVAAYFTARVAAGCAYGTEQDGVNIISSVTVNAGTIPGARAAIDNRCGI